jgi:peroxiredoxin
MTRPSTIADRVAEMHAAQAAEPPSELRGAFAREQAVLAAMVPALVPAGTVLPDARLLDVHGADTTLYAATGGRRSVLIFYRGSWCPYCNIALSTYREQLLAKLEKRKVGLIAISPEKPDGSLTMQQKHDLAFTVVSDPGNRLARFLGIVTRPSPGARAAQLQLGLDLTAVNADGTTELPMPATVILDAEHVLQWIEVHPDYSARTEPALVLEEVDRLASDQGRA